MQDDHKRRRPEHDKFSSPEFERQQRQRTDDPADRLPSRLRARLSLDVPGGDEHQQPGDMDDRQRNAPSDNQQQQHNAGGSGGNDGGSGGRARIEFNLERVQPPPAEEAKPRVSRKYSAELPASDPPVLRRPSGGQDSTDRPVPAARADDRPREQQQQQQQGEGGSRRLQSPDRGPLGRDRDRDKDRPVSRDRSIDRNRERERGDRGVADRDRGLDRTRMLDRDRDRTRDWRDSPADRMHDRGDVPRSSSRPDGPADRSRTDSAERSRPAAAADHSRERSRERSRLGARERSPARSSREHSRERGVQGARDHARDPPGRHPPPREGVSRGRDAAGLGSSRDSSRPRGPAGEAGREQRPPARDTKDDGFARPQPRPPPPAQQQQQQQFTRPAPPPRPRLHIQWDEINKADAMLAAVRARHAGLVEQQLKHLILTRALATDNAWDRACQAANVPPEQVDGPLVTAARRADCDRLLQSRVSANMLPPLDPSLPSHLGEAVTEDAYIQQLQAVINRYEQQSAAPYCAEVWALKGAPSARRGGGGVQQEAPEGVSYSLLLPAELRGQLWDV